MKTLIFIFLLVCAGGNYAQNVKPQMKEADKLFKNEQYEEALKEYKKLLTITPQDVDLNYKYGACVVMLNKDNKQALKMLLYAKEKGKTDKEVAYFIGRAYENDGQFDKAIEYYERFISVADKEQIKTLKVKASIKSCKKLLKE
jgi:tetratricopeptide (TPR) repeat protein